MISYRITKFNPKKRNQDGAYLDDSEWTSISDIGNPKYRNVTYQEYEKIETAYVDSIKQILKSKNIENLLIDSLESYNSADDFDDFRKEGRLKNLHIDFNKDIKGLKEKAVLEFNKIDKIIRLILRETIWMNLINSGIKIIFGYDYYMYVECSELNDSIIKNIEKMGLFVEPNMGQTEFIIVDENGNEI